MRINFYIFLLFFCLAQSSWAQDVVAIRKSVVRAVDSEKMTNHLYQELSNLRSKDPLILAYIATLEGLKAKHAWNPYSKIKHVKQADKLIDRAVSLAPDELEIRFMRFSLQHYTPAFLGFSKQLDEDRKAIVRLFELRKFGRSEADLVHHIAKFMIDSKRCTPAELQILKKFV